MASAKAVVCGGLISLFAAPHSQSRGPGHRQRDEEVDIIVNKANPVNELSLADAKKIFVGDKGSWPNGKRITVLMLAPGRPNAPFCSTMSTKWEKRITANTSCRRPSPAKWKPRRRTSDRPPQVKQAVAANIGAIGYVKGADVDDSVKVVLKIP